MLWWLFAELSEQVWLNIWLDERIDEAFGPYICLNATTTLYLSDLRALRGVYIAR